MKNELRIVLQAVRKSLDDQVNDLAAAIAYWALFSIFPLLIGALSLAGYFLDSVEVQTRIYELVTDLLPGSADLVKKSLVSVVRYRGSMGLIGILMLLWTASKGLAAVTRAVNRALGTERPHSYVVSKLRFFAMTAAVTVLVVVSIAIVVAIEIFFQPSFLARLGLTQIDISRVQGWLVSFLFVFCMFALIYRMTPYIKVRWRQILPGALFAAILFEMGKVGFVVYLERAAGLEAIYGSLSSILVLLLWLYLSALVLVYGAEYNIVRWEFRQQTD